MKTNPIEEEEIKVVSLKLITSDGTPSACWLDDIKELEVFFVKKRSPQSAEERYVCPMFRLLGRTEKTTLLISPHSPMKQGVDARSFCNQWDLWENLGVIPDGEIHDPDRLQGNDGISDDEVERPNRE
jgi:hypothetical protein